MKKILFLTIFIILLFGIWQICFAIDLLLDYPDVPGAQKLSEASDLPNIINYIYKFALLACGITAFVSILFGAIQYVTSAGDSSKAGDAKDRITQALWGILILLSAVLILRTINPDLVSLSLTLPETNTPATTEKGYSCICTLTYPVINAPSTIKNVEVWKIKDSSAIWGTERCKEFNSAQEAGTLCYQACKKLEFKLTGPYFNNSKVEKCN